MTVLVIVPSCRWNSFVSWCICYVGLCSAIFQLHRGV
jgi:hypothetical protein